MHVYTDTLPTMNCWLDTFDNDQFTVRTVYIMQDLCGLWGAVYGDELMPEISANIFGVEGDRNLVIWGPPSIPPCHLRTLSPPCHPPCRPAMHPTEPATRFDCEKSRVDQTAVACGWRRGFL